mmetsp:Transcript_2714/g.6200  ORF Transcript_2714/g.6200 Transcript_2714/m.6200 type:complete len:300 (+) Transcript_2714:1227-2126(+)
MQPQRLHVSPQHHHVKTTSSAVLGANPVLNPSPFPEVNRADRCAPDNMLAMNEDTGVLFVAVHVAVQRHDKSKALLRIEAQHAAYQSSVGPNFSGTLLLRLLPVSLLAASSFPLDKVCCADGLPHFLTIAELSKNVHVSLRVHQHKVGMCVLLRLGLLHFLNVIVATQIPINAVALLKKLAQRPLVHPPELLRLLLPPVVHVRLSVVKQSSLRVEPPFSCLLMHMPAGVRTLRGVLGQVRGWKTVCVPRGHAGVDLGLRSWPPPGRGGHLPRRRRRWRPTSSPRPPGWRHRPTPSPEAS